ncbi:MAG: HAMP domain-containing sensor histidine kinase [Acutalibacteraceae bacterium]|nr:HAMP domain-containing sensor histidine kinase [Acutalibacteraceae bacterium]
MQLEIRFKSIAVRWFLNIFLIVAAVIVVAVVAFSALFSSIYTERIEVLATDYAYEFYALSGTDSKTFKDTAVEIAGEFQYKNKIEVQVIDLNGQILVSTSGFQSENEPMPDYYKAKENGSSSVLKSTTLDGEPIMAGTTVIYGSQGEKLGAYRWITSMRAANRTMGSFVIAVILAAAAVMAFCAFSGLFFIKSIVRPIRDVSNMARKIAMGDFESRININKNDEIGELCDTINYMASELSQAQNLKNDFISSVSHELRTPLTAIRGWGETAKMSLGTDEELVRRGLDVVLNEADRLSGLVEELLDFSRIESGRLSVVSQPLNISQLLSESADMYTELARQQGIELIFTRPSEELQVMGDADRLKQVFINIIDNAVKYTESGGQVLINQLHEEGCARIVVSDTGVGIPAQDIDRVKEKFYKANKVVRGSGIGLAVADEIIKQHHGLLFIESTEGVGTTATIVLPLYEPEPIPEAADTHRDEINLQEDENG